MVRTLIIFAEVVVLIIILRSPFIQYLFSDIQNTVSGWFVNLSALPEKRELNQLQENAMSQLGKLKPFQKNYITQVTSSKASVKHFQKTYCNSKEVNPNFIGHQRAQFCMLIGQSSLLTDT